MSREVSEFLMSHGVVMTHSTLYHPTRNSQYEREIGTIRRTIHLALRSLKLADCQWELVLVRVLHSILFLLCTSTNQTSHERLFSFHRRSFNGYSLPSWLTTPGSVLLRRFVCSSKSDLLMEEIEFDSANPYYAHIRYLDGRQTMVSTKDLARSPKNPSGQESSTSSEETMPVSAEDDNQNIARTESKGNDQKYEAQDLEEPDDSCVPDGSSPSPVSKPSEPLRRSMS